MSSGLWIPGIASAPLEDFVARIQRQAEEFAAEAGVERAVVEIELVDGARLTVDRLSAEPGFGFVTIVPFPDASDEDVPERLIVPVGTIRRIELGRATEQRARFGFSVPAGPG